MMSRKVSQLTTFEISEEKPPTKKPKRNFNEAKYRFQMKQIWVNIGMVLNDPNEKSCKDPGLKSNKFFGMNSRYTKTFNI